MPAFAAGRLGLGADLLGLSAHHACVMLEGNLTAFTAMSGWQCQLSLCCLGFFLTSCSPARQEAFYFVR